MFVFSDDRQNDGDDDLHDTIMENLEFKADAETPTAAENTKFSQLLKVDGQEIDKTIKTFRDTSCSPIQWFDTNQFDGSNNDLKASTQEENTASLKEIKESVNVQSISLTQTPKRQNQPTNTSLKTNGSPSLRRQRRIVTFSPSIAITGVLSRTQSLGIGAVSPRPLATKQSPRSILESSTSSPPCTGSSARSTTSVISKSTSSDSLSSYSPLGLGEPGRLKLFCCIIEKQMHYI